MRLGKSVIPKKFNPVTNERTPALATHERTFVFLFHLLLHTAGYPKPSRCHIRLGAKAGGRWGV